MNNALDHGKQYVKFQMQFCNNTIVCKCTGITKHKSLHS